MIRYLTAWTSRPLLESQKQILIYISVMLHLHICHIFISRNRKHTWHLAVILMCPPPTTCGVKFLSDSSRSVVRLISTNSNILHMLLWRAETQQQPLRPDCLNHSADILSGSVPVRLWLCGGKLRADFTQWRREHSLWCTERYVAVG